VSKLFESKYKSLDEAGFESNGSTYKCAFGHYSKDGKSISRDEYMKAKSKATGTSSSQGESPKKSDSEKPKSKALYKSVSRPAIPNRVDVRHVKQSAENALEGMGAETYEAHQGMTTYEFNGPKSPLRISVELSNHFRKQGYDTEFKDGAEEATSFSVVDPKGKKVTYTISTNNSISNGGKGYIDVSVEEDSGVSPEKKEKMLKDIYSSTEYEDSKELLRGLEDRVNSGEESVGHNYEVQDYEITDVEHFTYHGVERVRIKANVSGIDHETGKEFKMDTSINTKNTKEVWGIE
jgi:hypothetical protein